MMSQTAVDHINKAIEAEKENALALFPLFASPHETYAVILEELQEAEADIKTFKKDLDEFWSAVKANDPSTILLKCEILRAAARNIINEAVQVAAVADKGMISIAAKQKEDAENAPPEQTTFALYDTSGAIDVTGVVVEDGDDEGGSAA